MDDNVANLVGGKRRRDNASNEPEDVKDNVKLQRRWIPRPEEDASHQIPNFNGISVENWFRMQQQKPEVVAAVNPSALNLHQRAMAAAALQDLRDVDSSKQFYQTQLQQQLQFQQHQQPLQPMPQLPTPETSNGPLRELSPSLLPQSPLRLPPPLIRTPPLYSESELHNGSPTSSSSSPYPNLQNMPMSHPQPPSAPLHVQEYSTEQAYSNMLQTTQNGLIQHPNQQHQRQHFHQQQQQQPQKQHLQQQPQPQQPQQQQQQQQQQAAGLSEGNNLILRELQQGNSWYSPMRDPSTYVEAQSLASSSGHMQRMDTPSTSGSQIGTPNFPLQSITEFANPRALTSSQTCQSQGVYRDGAYGAHEQNMYSQFDLSGPMTFGTLMSPMGAPRMSPSPSTSRLGICPPQNDSQGRRILSGSYCTSNSVGGDPSFKLSPILIKAGLDENGYPQRSMPCPLKPVRSFTKVYKRGSITRALNVRRFSNYNGLLVELERMFSLEGQLDQTGWLVVFIDNEGDLLLVGDDPWEYFVKSVRGIQILSPLEMSFFTNEEAINASAPRQIMS